MSNVDTARKKITRWTPFRTLIVASAVLGIGIALFSWSRNEGFKDSTGQTASVVSRLNIDQALRADQNSALVVPFVKNSGQYSDSGVRYSASIFKGAVYVKDSGVVYSLLAEETEDEPRELSSYLEAMAAREEPRTSAKVVAFEVKYGEKTLAAQGKEIAPAKISYFRGMKETSWRQGLESFNSVSLGELWERVEVALKAHENNVEQLFFVKPQGNPEEIKLSFKGISGLSIDEHGELVIAHAGGKFALTKPVAYQLRGDERKEIEVAYNLTGDGQVGFRVGAYDNNQVLIIDPLLASTYLGGTDEERYAYEGFGGHIYAGDRAIARDASGNIYIISQTRSSNYPTTAGVYGPSYKDAASYLKNDVVVSKLAPGLNTLLASTYIGGTNEDNAASIALDSSGNIYITGLTRSMDFPVLNAGHSISFNGGASDVFLAKLSGDLTTLLASTYLGGSSSDTAYSVVLDENNSIYLIGDTSSSNFPTRAGGSQTIKGAGTDAFIARLSTDLTTLQNATFLGGSGEDYGRALIKTSSGDLFAVVNTTSTDYPTTPGTYDQTHNGRLDVAISKLSANLSTLTASTLLGDGYDDLGYAVALDLSGNVVLGGMTESPNFPTTVAAYDSSHNGVYDSYVAKLSPDLNSLLGSTFLGGNNWEDVYSIGVNSLDEIFVMGSTRSSNFPVTAQVYKTTLSGTTDGFIAKFPGNLSTLPASTYLGGSGNLDAMLSFVFNSAEDLVTVGVTNSADFPTTPGAYTSTARGLRDMVVLLMTRDLLADNTSSHLEVTNSVGNNTLSMVAGSSQSIKITVYDQYNNVLPSYDGDYSVTLNGTSLSPYGTIATCTNKWGSAVNFGTAMTMVFTRGIANCTMRAYKAETTALNANIGTLNSNGNPNYALALTVTKGAVSAAGSYLSVSPSPGTVQSAVNLHLTVDDLYGNGLGPDGASQTVTFQVTGANTASLTGIDNSDGTYSVAYTPTSSGSDVITARVNNTPVIHDSDGTSDGTFNITINSLGLDHLEVRYQNPVLVYNSSALFQAGTSYTLEILAKDALGNVVVSYTGHKTLIFSGPTASSYGIMPTCSDASGTDVRIGSNTVVYFTNGRGACTFKPKNIESVSVDVLDATFGGAGTNSYGMPVYDLDLTVIQDTVTHLTIAGSATQVAGTPQIVTIKARDQFGNVHLGYGGDRLITFSGASASYNGTVPKVLDKTLTPVNFGSPTVLTFSAGVATASMTLYAREIVTIDVTDGTSSSVGSPLYELRVAVSDTGAAVASQCTIEASANPVGTCGLLGVIIRARDIYGNQLSIGGNAVVLNVTGANSGSPAVLDNADGSYLAQYAPVTSGADSITGTVDGGAIGKDLDGTSDGTFHETINNEASNTATWSGGTSGSWHVASNWIGGVVPGTSTSTCYDVVIDGAYTNAPVIDHAVTGRVVVRNLTLGATVSSTLTQTSAGSTNYLHVRNNLTVGASGTLNHTINGASPVHQTYVVVDGNMTVALGGKIDNTTRGYAAPYNGPGARACLAWDQCFGATHGGVGGYYTAPANQITYGSLLQPTTFGSSGGTNAAGGGVVKLVVGGTLAVDGQILVNGGTGAGVDGSNGWNGGGAGGSIWLDVGTLQGNGTVAANAGMGCNSSGGGGGRVALYFNTNDYTGSLQAYGKARTSGWNPGGAGTVYVKDKAAQYGVLTIDNNNLTTGTTRGLLGTSLTVTSLNLTHGGYYQVAPGETLTNLASTWGDDGTLEVQAGGTFHADSLTTISNLKVINGSTLSLPQFSSMSSLTFTNNGIYEHSSSLLLINNGSAWYENGTYYTIGRNSPITDIIVTGSSLEFRNQSPTNFATFNSITINNGGVVTHPANGATPSYSLNLKLGNLTINGTGKIDVALKGYPPAYLGPGARGGLDSYNYFGATHGGVGGNLGASLANQNTYGSITEPITHGSSGGTNAPGGGAVKLSVSGDLILNGQILSNAGDGAGTPGVTGWNGGGAGGSIWIDTGSMQGNGNIKANAGNGCNSSPGGGGRIAVYYTSSSFTGTMQAYGGIYPLSSPRGGAGTIYTRDKTGPFGTLTIDNNGLVGGVTRGVAGSSLALLNMNVVNGGYYQLVPGESITNHTTLWNANGTVDIPSGAEFYAPNLSSLSNLQLVNAATISFPQLSSMSAFTFTNNGVYNNSSPTLTISGGSTWNENGTSPTIGTTVPITDITLNNSTLEFRNQTTTKPGVFNTITVNSGSKITHLTNGTSPTAILNLQLNTLSIQPGGTVDVSLRGYPAGYSGPGAGLCYGFYDCIGATHGGIGSAYNSYKSNKNPYGSLSLPITHGSSGGTGAAGGGVIKLTVAGVLTNNGEIISSGGTGAGTPAVTGWTGGGAGGSILIDATTLQGNGSFIANGGPGCNSSGGGGGRIALYYSTNSMSGAMQAYGATWLLGNLSTPRGGAGTIYLKDKAASLGTLLVGNYGSSSERTKITPGVTETVGTAIIKDDAIFQLSTSGTLNSSLLDVYSTGTLELNGYTTTTKALLSDVRVRAGGVLLHTGNTNTQAHVINMRANNLTVDAGGIVETTGYGYSAGNGAGAGSGNSGAGFGGNGGAGTAGSGGTNYGNMLMPLDLGSGAPGGGAGGGMMRMQIDNTLTLDGELRAKGAAGGVNVGGGAGGSILISAANLAGSGYMVANGGNGGGTNGGGGGGGRIAVYYLGQSFLTSGGHITSATVGQFTDPVGGTGTHSGAVGTLYMSYPHHYQLNGSATQNAGSSQNLTITLTDNYGNPFIWDGARTTILSGATASDKFNQATCVDNLGNTVPFGSPLTLSFVDGVATCSMTIYKVGSHHLDILDGLYTSTANAAHGLNVTVNGNAPAGVLYSTLSANKSAAFVGDAINALVTLYDDFGNPVITGSATVTMNVTGANPHALSVTNVGNGTYTASYVPALAGGDAITATVNGGPAMSDTDGVPDGVFHVAISGGPADHLTVTGNSTQFAGTAHTITIRAIGPSGAVDGSYTGLKSIALGGANVSPFGNVPTCRDRNGVDVAFGTGTTLDFVSGVATCQMYLYKIENALIGASDGTLSSDGNVLWKLAVEVTIQSNAMAQGIINASPSPAVDNDSIAVSMQTVDLFGNIWAKTGLNVVLLVLGSNSGTLSVTDSGNGTYTSNYTAVNVGTDQIRGTVSNSGILYDADGVSDGVFNLLVQASVVPHHFEVTGSVTQVAGSSQQITISAKGLSNNTSPSYRGTKTVTLAGGLSSVKGSVPTCTDKNGVAIQMNSAMSLNFTNGVAHCEMVLYKAGSQLINASDGSISSSGNTAWGLDVAVSAAAVDNASAFLSGSAPNVDTKDTVTTTVYGRDQYGNNLTTGGGNVTVTVTGTNDQILTVTDQGDGSYTCTYIARNAGNDQIRGTFNGVAITSDNDGLSDGVFHLTVADTITATHLEIKGTGTQEAGAFQAITIQALDDEGYRDYGYIGTKALKLSGANNTTSNKQPACVDRQGKLKLFGTLTNLDFVNGQATCQMILYKVELAHVDAECGVLNSYGDPAYDLDVDVLPAGTGVASALIDARPNPVVVNGTVTVTITTLDEYGNQTYDVSSVVTANVAGANVHVLIPSDQTDGTYKATYAATASGVDNITGTLNSSAFTADTDGLSNGTYVLRVISEGFADHLELSGANSQDVGSSQILTVSAKMLGGGTDTSYAGVHEVTFSGAHAAPNAIVPTCRDLNGVDKAFGLATDLSFIEGVATCRMYLYKAEIAEIDATDTVISTVGDPAWDLDTTVTINPGGVAQGRISGTVTTAIENEIVGLTVQAVDAYGNDWAKAGLAVVLNVTGANTLMPAVTDNSDGTYSASYQAAAVGDDIVRGTVNTSAILYDTEGASDGVYHLTTLAGIVPHHFEVGGASTQVAGSAQVITITARAATGEIAPSYRGNKNITLSGGLSSPSGQAPSCTDKNGVPVALESGTILAFNNGVAQCNLRLYKAGDQAIDAGDGALTTAGDPLWDLDVNVQVGAVDNASALLVGSSTSINTKDTESVTIYARDAYWNNLTSGGATVTLAVTGANAANLAVSDEGDGSYRASYLAHYPGLDSIRGTFNAANIARDSEGVNDGVYHLVVNDTIVARHLEVTGSPTQFSGTFQTIVISAKDDEGYLAYGYQGVKTLKLSGGNKSPAGFKPACLDISGAIKPFGAATVLQFVNGQASCLMVLYQLEIAHVDASDNGTALNSFDSDSWDLDVLVQANSGDNQGGVISATPNPAQKGSTIAVTVSISDSFGNSLSASGLDVQLSVSGANAQTLTVIDNHDGTYSAQYLASHHGVDFIDGTINSEPITADTDGNNDGTYQLTILPLNSVLSASPNPSEKGREVTLEVAVTGTQSGVSVTGLSVNLSVNGANSGSYHATELGGGKYHAKYIAANEGVDFITGTVDAALVKADTDGVSDGIFQLPVVGSRNGGGGRFIAGVARYESSSGRPAIGVDVTDGERSAATNQYGYYVLYDVPNGSYTLSGGKSGYSVYTEAGVNPITMSDAPVVNANLIVSASVPVEVVAPWNSFLGNVVIAEIFNSGTEPLTAELTLYRQEGSKADADPEKMLLRIPVEQQRDIILNGMKGFKLDSYGVLRIKFSHPYYNGQVSYYKVRPGEVGFRENADQLKKEFDYALANPFVGPTYGKSYVLFNTHQPSGRTEDLEKLVPNWLTVVNGSATNAAWFTIRKYDQSGKLLVPTSAVGMVNCVLKSGEIRCKVPAFGRIDVDGGHVSPGPNHTGLIEILPDNAQLPYSANLVRYGMGAPPTVYTETYDFAAYIQARAGSFKEQVMPISTTSGAENWLEIANVSSSKQTVTAEYYYYDGEFAGAQNFKLGPKGQVHVNVEPIIGKGHSGVVKLTGQGSNGVIAHNLSYYRLDDRSTYVVTGTQASEPNRARIAGTYNRFLNMSNWLRIINLSSEERNVTLRLHVNQQSLVYSYKIQPYGGIDIPLHDTKYGIAKNSLGMFEVENTDPGAIFAQMFRMKHADTAPFDFVMPTEVR